MDPQTVEAAITLAAALGQLGIAAVALKVAMAVKTALVELKSAVSNHEGRISKLEES